MAGQAFVHRARHERAWHFLFHRVARFNSVARQEGPSKMELSPPDPRRNFFVWETRKIFAGVEIFREGLQFREILVFRKACLPPQAKINEETAKSLGSHGRLEWREQSEWPGLTLFISSTEKWDVSKILRGKKVLFAPSSALHLFRDSRNWPSWTFGWTKLVVLVERSSAPWDRLCLDNHSVAMWLQTVLCDSRLCQVTFRE